MARQGFSSTRKSRGLRHLHGRLGKFMVAAAMLAAVASTTAPDSAAAWEMRVCADPKLTPFSNGELTGFENRIAAILAETLGAELTFYWFPQSSEMVSQHLRTGDCDMIIGVQDGQAGMLSTLAYYRSPFVFVQRADSPYSVGSLDDPALRDLRIGVQYALGPAYDSLVRRNLRDNIAHTYEFELNACIEDVANGEIDVAIAWGPTAGYFASLQPVPLAVSPVTPEFEPPFTPMFINIAIGVRRGDEALRDLLDTGLAKRWEEINAVLEEYHVPTMLLQRPRAGDL